MRPRGEIRTALADSAVALVSGGLSCVTYRDVAMHAQVSWDAARCTVRNMARAGELLEVGEVRIDGVCRPLKGYVPAQQGQGSDPTADLTRAVNCWANFV